MLIFAFRKLFCKTVKRPKTTHNDTKRIQLFVFKGNTMHVNPMQFKITSIIYFTRVTTTSICYPMYHHARRKRTP